jgi:hypothetical protein
MFELRQRTYLVRTDADNWPWKKKSENHEAYVNKGYKQTISLMKLFYFLVVDSPLPKIIVTLVPPRRDGYFRTGNVR